MPRDDRRLAPPTPPKGAKGGGKASAAEATQRPRRDGKEEKAKGPAAETPTHAVEQRRRVPPRLLGRYRDQVVPALLQEFGYRNVMEVPRLRKIVLNVGLGEALTNPKALEAATQMLATISGQKPVTTKARSSVAGFKIRKGMTIGAMVTLRSQRMYDFLDRLVNAALPRVRDFHGVPWNSFDGAGNYSLGIREQVIFPEIEYSQVDRVRGFQVTLVTSAKSPREAQRLLELLGMPFSRN